MKRVLHEIANQSTSRLSRVSSVDGSRVLRRASPIHIMLPSAKFGALIELTDV